MESLQHFEQAVTLTLIACSIVQSPVSVMEYATQLAAASHLPAHCDRPSSPMDTCKPRQSQCQGNMPHTAVAVKLAAGHATCTAFFLALTLQYVCMASRCECWQMHSPHAPVCVLYTVCSLHCKHYATPPLQAPHLHITH
jgi:hypothetical protein